MTLTPEWSQVAVQFLILITAALGLGKVIMEFKEVHKTVNSRLTEFLELARKSSHAEGVLEQKERGLEASAVAPLPVADDRTAQASERVAVATERVARAAEKES